MADRRTGETARCGPRIAQDPSRRGTGARAGSLRGDVAARRDLARVRTRSDRQRTLRATACERALAPSPTVKSARCNEESRNGAASPRVGWCLPNPSLTLVIKSRCAARRESRRDRSARADDSSASQFQGSQVEQRRRSPFLRHPERSSSSGRARHPTSGATRPHAGPRRARPLEAHQWQDHERS